MKNDPLKAETMEEMTELFHEQAVKKKAVLLRQIHEDHKAERETGEMDDQSAQIHLIAKSISYTMYNMCLGNVINERLIRQLQERIEDLEGEKR